MTKYVYLARADAIMAEKDVNRKSAERFWRFQDEIEDPKNAWWNMNDIMRKLDGFRPRAPSEWLTQAIYDRLVEQVSDFWSCTRPVPDLFMEHTQWKQEIGRIRLRRGWRQ